MIRMTSHTSHTMNEVSGAQFGKNDYLTTWLSFAIPDFIINILSSLSFVIGLRPRLSLSQKTTCLQNLLVTCLFDHQKNFPFMVE